ncbi:MAG: apolipoprotein N-acyltransferase [Sporichthyaceae bacterium]
MTSVQVAPHNQRRPASFTVPVAPIRVGVGWALAGALALAAAFPPWDLWFLAPLGPGALLLAVANRSARAAFGLGAIFGAVFFATLLTWMLNLGAAPWLALILSQVPFMGLLGVLVALGWRSRARLLVVPCAWVAVEALRGRVPLGGFPWGRLGFSQADSPMASWAALGGIPLLSTILAAVGTAAAAGILAGWSWRRAIPVAPVALAVAIGGGALVGVGAPTGTTESSVAVAVVQGNVPRARSVAEQARAEGVTRNHADATWALARKVAAGELPAPDLVIWPENATDIDPDRDPAVRAIIEGALAAIDRPILVGAILDAPDGRGRNVGQLWVPGTGPGATYDKRHLVPFGEYIPLRSVLGGLGDLTLVGRDFAPGARAAVINSGEARIGDVICFEVAFDGAARDAVRAGANVLVVQSNNASYMRDGQRGETLQQLAMARLRAIEHNRAVAVATTSGISALIAPDGSVQARTGMWRQQTLVGSMELRAGRTVATRAGAWPEAALALIGVVPVLLLLGRRARSFTRPGRGR